MPANFAPFISAHPWILLIAAVWTIPWKGVALWRAARNQSVAWFVVLLLVNTLGMLDIAYIFFFSRKKFPPHFQEASRLASLEKKVVDIKRD